MHKHEYHQCILSLQNQVISNTCPVFKLTVYASVSYHLYILSRWQSYCCTYTDNDYECDDGNLKDVVKEQKLYFLEYLEIR